MRSPKSNETSAVWQIPNGIVNQAVMRTLRVHVRFPQAVPVSQVSMSSAAFPLTRRG
jgi:hypothetical protein